MYVFYDSTGKIIGGVAADSPDVVLTRIPDGTTPIYLDDTAHADVWANLGRYQIEYNTPVPRVFTAEDVEQAKQSKSTALDTECKATILGGFVSSAVGEVHSYAFDMESQTNLMSEFAMLNADSTISTVDWKTVDAGIVTHTREQFMQVCRDGQAWKKGNMEKYRQLKSHLLQAASMEQVEAIHWESAVQEVNNPLANQTNPTPKNEHASNTWLHNGLSSFLSKITR